MGNKQAELLGGESLISGSVKLISGPLASHSCRMSLKKKELTAGRREKTFYTNTRAASTGQELKKAVQMQIFAN